MSNWHSSWHYQYYDGKSIITELLDLLDNQRCVLVHMKDGTCFTVTSKDDIEVGEGAMMIGSDDIVRFINTNEISYIELYRSYKQANNINKPYSLNDSEEE